MISLQDSDDVPVDLLKQNAPEEFPAKNSKKESKLNV